MFDVAARSRSTTATGSDDVDHLDTTGERAVRSRPTTLLLLHPRTLCALARLGAGVALGLATTAPIRVVEQRPVAWQVRQGWPEFTTVGAERRPALAA